ncbi:uncharacterized protein [Aristolochia californica]|uniref:uncharacterized protein n=1 Tax=Aristolochia californica TaxID=171875 RepID=UPI0035DBA807
MRSATTAVKLSLENYDDFTQIPGRRPEFSLSKLQEIITMHGFIKLHGHKKLEILEACCSIDLMHSRRSTLKDDVSSDAFLSIEEVKQDLANLGWQKCEVQTLQIVRLAAEKNVKAGPDLQTICASSRSDQCSVQSEHKKRRMSKDEEIASDDASGF